MMNWQQLKEKYARFKQWQREPVTYVNCDDVHYCNNCGLMFSGNYCPRCSQKADVGRISWKSVRNGIMDIWGLGTRSLLFSILQLLLRPGYFINDYISGRRQVSFPPVKMLFIVTVIYSIVVYWFFPQVLGIHLYDSSEDARKAMSDYYQWYQSHYGWAMLMMAILAIIPTWIMFRYSPRNTRHTLPEGFFIQILFSVLMVVLNFFLIFLGLIHELAFSVTFSLLTMFYYVVGYMQLFGYGFWGTFWREAFIMLTIAFLEFILIFVVFDIDMAKFINVQITPEQNKLMKYGMLVFSLISAVVILAVGYAINLIVTRKSRRELNQSVVK